MAGYLIFSGGGFFACLGQPPSFIWVGVVRPSFVIKKRKKEKKKKKIVLILGVAWGQILLKNK
jgi:hypothetical protein